MPKHQVNARFQAYKGHFGIFPLFRKDACYTETKSRALLVVSMDRSPTKQK